MSVDVEIFEEEFISLTDKKLLEMFKKHKNLNVIRKNGDVFSITYTSGLPFGIKYAEIILLRHQERIYHYSSTDDDPIFHTRYEKVLSPLSFEKAICKLKLLYKNTKEGKRTLIRDLTDKEIDEIIWTLNAPID